MYLCYAKETIAQKIGLQYWHCTYSNETEVKIIANTDTEKLVKGECLKQKHC